MFRAVCAAGETAAARQELWAAYELQGRALESKRVSKRPAGEKAVFGGWQEAVPGGLNDRRRLFLIEQIPSWLNAAANNYRVRVCGACPLPPMTYDALMTPLQLLRLRRSTAPSASRNGCDASQWGGREADGSDRVGAGRRGAPSDEAGGGARVRDGSGEGGAAQVAGVAESDDHQGPSHAAPAAVQGFRGRRDHRVRGRSSGATAVSLSRAVCGIQRLSSCLLLH